MRNAVWFGVLVAFLSAVAFGLPGYPPSSIKGQVTAIVDGDTIDVLLKSVPDGLAGELTAGYVVHIRYIGINAPEADTDEGQIATELNAALVQGQDRLSGAGGESLGPLRAFACVRVS